MNTEQKQHLNIAFIKCVEDNNVNNLSELKQFIEQGADVNAVDIRSNSSGEIALHIACRNKNLEFVQFLIEAGANVHKKNEYGETALHYACFTCSGIELNLKIIELLICCGANPYQKDNFGKTPMDNAKMCGFDNFQKTFNTRVL